MAESPESRPRTGLVPDLSRPIDERIKRALRDAGLGDTPRAAAVGGGLGSSGGATGSPSVPETFVESITKSGVSPVVTGAVVLQQAGTHTITQAAVSPHFTHRSAAALIVSSLPATGDSDILYRRSSDNTLWWDSTGTGAWVQLGLAGAPVDAQYLTLAANGTLTQERVLTISDWLEATDGGAGAAYTLKAQIKRTGTTLSTIHADDSLKLDDGGELQFDNGAGSPDVRLSRGAANRLDLADGDILRLNEQLQFAELASAPSTAGGGIGQLYYRQATDCHDNKLFNMDETGAAHDLTVQDKAQISGQELLQCALYQTEIASFALNPAPVSIVNVYSFDFTNNELDDAAAYWSWLARRDDGIMQYEQNDLAIGFPFRRFAAGADRATGGRVIVKARVRVGGTLAAWASIKLFVGDDDGDGDTILSGELKTTVIAAANTWYEVSLTASGGTGTDGLGIDVTAMTSNLRAGLILRGAEVPNRTNVLTWVYVERITVEQWVN